MTETMTDKPAPVEVTQAGYEKDGFRLSEAIVGQGGQRAILLIEITTGNCIETFANGYEKPNAETWAEAKGYLSAFARHRTLTHVQNNTVEITEQQSASLHKALLASYSEVQAPIVTPAQAAGPVLLEALKDDPNWIAAGIPDEAIEAGIAAWDAAHTDMAKEKSDRDWDEGMIVAAIFKAVGRAITRATGAAS